MTEVRIYSPAKSAMQSGPGRDGWILEYIPDQPVRIDPLMGWVGSDDTRNQIRLTFPTKQAALAWAARKQMTVADIGAAPARGVRLKNYADNFRVDKLEFGRF